MTSIKKYIFEYWWTLVPILLILTLYLYLGNTGSCMLGGDWSLPCNSIQARSMLRDSFFGWNYITSFLGVQQTNLYTALIFNTIIFFLGEIFGFVNLYLLIPAFYTLIFSYGIHRLQKFYAWNKINALTGLLFILSLPIYFNYLIMGWINFLLVISFIPLYIYSILMATRETEENIYNVNTACASLILSFSSLQSQGPVIYLLILMSFIPINFNYKYFKFIGINIAVFILLNLYWLIPTIFFPPNLLTDKNVLNSGETIGTGQHLNLLNSIRGWGVLANYQYETIVGKLGSLAAFVMPIVAFFGFFIKSNKKLIPLIILVSISLALIYINSNRYILNYIPFSTVIRDLSRINSITIIFWGLLFIFSLEKIEAYCVYYVYYSVLAVSLIAIVILYYPYYSGSFANSESTTGMDFRMRLYTQSAIPKEISDNLCSDENKALFLPIGGLVQSIEKKEFSRNPFKSFWDLEAAYSCLRGSIQLTDRVGTREKYIYDYLFSDINNDIVNKLEYYNIKYIIFRKDLYNEQSYIDKQLLYYLKLNNKVSLIFSDNYYQIYSLDYKFNNIFILSNNKKYNVDSKRFNQTIYEIRLDKKGVLYFNDVYSKNWMLVKVNFYNNLSVLRMVNFPKISIIQSESNDKKINTFTIDTLDDYNNTKYFLLYVPQIVFNIALLISLAGFVLILIKFRKDYVKKICNRVI